jgi:plastocyanin
MLLMTACGGDMAPPAPAPLPAGPVTTANVYILPGAVDLGPIAFGDEPVVIFKGERMRWRNLDLMEHDVVADSPVLPEFMTTGPLAPGEEKSFDMSTLGTTKVHCTIHPQMVGTLIVKER